MFAFSVGVVDAFGVDQLDILQPRPYAIACGVYYAEWLHPTICDIRCRR